VGAEFGLDRCCFGLILDVVVTVDPLSYSLCWFHHDLFQVCVS